ncbi:MAG: TrmH family RNA methyltransferase [Actinomycetia bacterium]|nr:TrmH family RNA methyltransferase [Actinomycetes bacterium]
MADREEPGVGPWPSDWALPTGEEYDPELLRDGDRRNVEDRYRYWRHEAIVADLDARRHPLEIAVENWTHDFNIGSVIRTANAFNVSAFHIVGRRRWNRRGAMVTDRYQHEHHHPRFESLERYARAKGLEIVAVDNVPGSVPIEETSLPRECVLVFGGEGPGLTPEAREAADLTVHITQFGSTRSINAGAAAAIAMHTWALEHVHDWTPSWG